MSLGNFNVGTMEDVFVHQLWELKLPFFNAFTTAHPSGRMLHALRELWPGVPDKAFSLHRNVKLNGGNTVNDDVVSFTVDGITQVGQLKLCVGVNDGAQTILWALVTPWASLGKTSDGGVENFRVTDFVSKIPATSLGTIFTHRFSADRSTCSIILPYELQPRA